MSVYSEKSYLTFIHCSLKFKPYNYKTFSSGTTSGVWGTQIYVNQTLPRLGLQDSLCESDDLLITYLDWVGRWNLDQFLNLNSIMQSLFFLLKLLIVKIVKIINA